MKHFLPISLSIFCLSVLLTACNSSNTIEVDIKKLPAQKVRLEEIKGPEFILIDSATLEAGKPFSLNAALGKESMYRLYFEQDKYIMLALEAGDRVKIEGDWTSIENYKVSGSSKSAVVKQLVTGTRQSIIDMRTFQAIFDTLKAAGKTAELKEAQKDYQLNNIQFINYLKEFADTASSAVAALMAINIINPKLEAPFVAQFYERLEERFPGNELAAIYKKRFIGSPGISTAPVNSKQGNQAADFMGTSPTGKTIRLQDYRGKYVLIDFWASWCGPCREENPAVVAAYKQFKDKNFDILGVSLDTDKDNWTKAIAKDELTWEHISELKGWDDPIAQKYRVTSIPANFLVDPNGLIIAKDLRGEALIAKLKEVIK